MLSAHWQLVKDPEKLYDLGKSFIAKDNKLMTIYFYLNFNANISKYEA